MWRDAAYLLDMLIAARHALEFSRDLTWEEFRHSRLHQHAIAKALENLGEAARKVSEETRPLILKFPGLRSSPCGIALRMTTSISTCSGCGRYCKTMFLH